MTWARKPSKHPARSQLAFCFVFFFFSLGLYIFQRGCFSVLNPWAIDSTSLSLPSPIHNFTFLILLWSFPHLSLRAWQLSQKLEQTLCYWATSKCVLEPLALRAQSLRGRGVTAGHVEREGYCDGRETENIHPSICTCACMFVFM